MFLKYKKLILMIAAITLLIFCTAIGISKYIKYTHAERAAKALADVRKDKINVNCCGKGEPVVIFESGLNCGSSSWNYVQPVISKITKTFSYDRIDDGRSTKDQVYELHALLADTKVKGPYIIVAHSLGGFNARVFAGTYPDEVAGIIFVDSSSEKQHSNPKFRSENSREENKMFDTDDAEVKEIRKKDALRNMPIIVLTADKEDSPDIRTDWINYQNDIASLSNRSKHIIVSKSSHFIQIDHPDVVIDAIKEMIKEVK